MSVILETSKGDIVLDLFVDECPKTVQNFLKYDIYTSWYHLYHCESARFQTLCLFACAFATTEHKIKISSLYLYIIWTNLTFCVHTDYVRSSITTIVFSTMFKETFYFKQVTLQRLGGVESPSMACCMGPKHGFFPMKLFLH